MIKLIKYITRSEFIKIIIVFILIIFQVYADLKLPDYMAQLTTLVQTPGSSRQQIYQNGTYMLLFAFASLTAASVVGFIISRVAASYARRLRFLVFKKVDSLSNQEIAKFSTASLITRSTNDIVQVQLLIAMGLQVMIKAPIMAIWAIFKIANKGFAWSLATAVSVVILVTIIILILSFVFPKFNKMQSLVDNLNKVTRENLSGVRVVRAYNAENYQQQKFEQANTQLTLNQLYISHKTAYLMPFIVLVMSGLSLAIYWIGAYLIEHAIISDKLPLFADMVVFSSYAMQVIMAFMLLIMIFIMTPRSLVAAKRINEVLSSKSSIINGDKIAGIDTCQGQIEFDQVSFKYPDASEYILTDISFKINKGERVAFIGSTGSGKSTLINLISRFYDVSKGRILIEGIDIKEYQLQALYQKIGYAFQKAILFKGTIADNIAFGTTAVTQEAIVKAAQIAQADDFIEQLDQQYLAEVAQGGTNLSGGQKQRVAIARALSRPVSFLIFDDSFSALDYQTDKKLRQALKEQLSDVTTLIVAQRIGTIKDVDKIIVLEEGRIVGCGKHQDLLKTCQVYQEIAYSQLSKEELL